MGIGVGEEVHDLTRKRAISERRSFRSLASWRGVLVAVREGRGVETMLLGVLVARLAATLAARAVSFRGVTCGPIGVHAIRIGDETGNRPESDGMFGRQVSSLDRMQAPKRPRLQNARSSAHHHSRSPGHSWLRSRLGHGRRAFLLPLDQSFLSCDASSTTSIYPTTGSTM